MKEKVELCRYSAARPRMALLCFALLWGSVLSSQKYSSAEEFSTSGSVDTDLVAFAYASHFFQRGTSWTLMPHGIEERSLTKLEKSNFPPGLEELFELHEADESEASQVDPHAKELPWEVKDSAGETIEISIARLANFGLIELFRHESTNLLDTPLCSRETLVDELIKIHREMRVCIAGFIAGERSDAMKLILTVKLRRLSTDFDLLIISHLSSEERSRMAEVARVALPLINFDQIGFFPSGRLTKNNSTVNAAGNRQ